MNLFKLIKYLLFSLLLLLLLHFETFYIGSIKFSHLWKGILLVFLIIKIFITKQKVDYFIYKPLLFIAFLQLLNIDLFQEPIYAISNFLIFLLIPVAGLFILTLKSKTIKDSLIFFASFFILSFIPYYLNWLPSYGKAYDLDMLGIIGTALVGPYQNPHGASITLATSLVVIVYFWFEGSLNKQYLLTIFILGMIFLFSTYVRTGVAMFIIGFLIIQLSFLFREKKIKGYIKQVFMIFSIFIVLGYFILPNQGIIERLTGQSKYFKEESIESIGSERGLIYATSLKLSSESNIVEKIIGMGRIELLNRMYKTIWLRVGSHNAFLDFLLVNGIIGLLAFLTYLIKIIKFLKNNRKSNYWFLSISLFFCLLVMSFVQGYDWLTANILFMLSISYYYKNEKLMITAGKMKK